MREILFRGKDVRTGEWVTGHNILGFTEVANAESADRAFFIAPTLPGLEVSYGWTTLPETPSIGNADAIVYINGTIPRVDPNTVGQYTGLTDKNGKKIFEGDIVCYQFDADDCPFPDRNTKKRYGRVFFSEWRSSFSVTANGMSDGMNNDLFKYVRNGNRVEVIGNIYDNPELLEVQA